MTIKLFVEEVTIYSEQKRDSAKRRYSVKLVKRQGVDGII